MNLQPFITEFDTRNGHCLIVKRMPAIQKEELQSVQSSMLMKGNVKGYLPLYVEEKDLALSLCYGFTGKKLLSQQLRSTELSMDDCYRLLLSVVDLLRTGSSYFLQPERTVLHPDYLFCDVHMQQLYGLYIPIENWEMSTSWLQGFKELLMHLLPHVKELDGAGIQRIMSLIQAEPTVDHLYVGLQQLRSGVAPHLSDVSPPRSHQAGYDKLDQSDDANRIASHQSAHRIENPFSQSGKGDTPSGLNPGERESMSVRQVEAAASEFGNRAVQTAPVEQPKSASEPISPSRPKVHVSNSKGKASSGGSTNSTSNSSYRTKLLLCIVLVVLIWSNMFMQPSEGMLYLCLGLTSWIAALAYWAWIKSSQTESTAPGEENEETAYDPLSWEELFGQEEIVASQTDRSVSQTQHKEPIGADDRPVRTSPSPVSSIEPYYEQLQDQTVVLPREPDKTVLLSAQTHGAAIIQQERYVLQASEDGRTTEISLPSFPFVIGRDESKVQYAVLSPGVSKLHCELLQEQGKVMLKDLGSSNGTFLNEQAMVPYKSYEMKDGDQIVLCNRRFVFQRLIS
ncbi:DUF6382 domain-containing protein [Marinicrinis sediminis]|uniref:DUF6382 domain-containing protein n=1 Tax=Marinicrinis sediminis TaxID=1652465 RepID=A0ABW5RDM2_9BACL